MGSIHEVEELKRAQEMRIDEFSRQELRDSQATIHELTSQIQELWKAIVPSPRGMMSRDQSLRP